MQIILSEETIKTVCRALRCEKNTLEHRLIQVEIGKAAKEKEDDFKNQLEKVNDALLIFNELSK